MINFNDLIKEQIIFNEKAREFFKQLLKDIESGKVKIIENQGFENEGNILIY